MADKQFITIDGVAVEFEKGLNVLEHAKKVGIDIPAFCYSPELSIYGACRMCLVETVDQRTGRTSLDSACSQLPKAGQVFLTNTTKLRMYRRNILELLLANHCRDCTTCEQNQRCALQKFADRYGITGVRYPQLSPEPKLDESSVCITRDNAKCILCGKCIRFCNEIQDVGAIDFAHRGSEMVVAAAGELPIGQSVCVGCGQCAAVCPTGAITVKNETKRVMKFIDDPKVKVSVQIAPAVRVAVGNEFGIPADENTFGKMVACLRRIGFDYVYDTNTAADMTILQEVGELLERLKTKPQWPLFSSCCPAWIQFAEKHHPEVLPHISTCKSPMHMYSGVFAKENEKDPTIVHGAIMPCTAKKYEASRQEFGKDGKKHVQFVLTTQELIRLIKEAGIDYKTIEPEAIEAHYGNATGAAVIFGVTGGVTEAALRYALGALTPDKATAEGYLAIAESGIRGLPHPDAKAGTLVDGVKVTTVKVGDAELKIGVASGLANATELINRIKGGEHFDFVEIMACPGGCIGGGGQPPTCWNVKNERAKGLYLADKEYTLNSSEKNPVMKEMYDGVLKGGKHTEHEVLHVGYGHGHGGH